MWSCTAQRGAPSAAGWTDSREGGLLGQGALVSPRWWVDRTLHHPLPLYALHHFSAGGGGKSAIGEFMKNMRQQNDNFEEQLLKLVRGCWSFCALRTVPRCWLLPGSVRRVRCALKRAAAARHLPHPSCLKMHTLARPSTTTGAHPSQGAQVPAQRQGAGCPQLRQLPPVLAGRQRRCAGGLLVCACGGRMGRLPLGGCCWAVGRAG